MYVACSAERQLAVRFLDVPGMGRAAEAVALLGNQIQCTGRPQLVLPAEYRCDHNDFIHSHPSLSKQDTKIDIRYHSSTRIRNDLTSWLWFLCQVAETLCAVLCAPCCTSPENCSGVLIHAASEELSPITGTLSVSVVLWATGKAAPATTRHVALPSQSGASFTFQGSEFTGMLQASGCAAVADCYVEAQLLHASEDTAAAEAPSLLAPVNHQWLTLWRDAALLPTNLTIVSVHPAPAAGGGALEVTVSSDAVAPSVMVHCGQETDFGRFDTNGITLLPHQPVTLLYTPQGFAPVGPHTPCSKVADFYAVAVNGLST